MRKGHDIPVIIGTRGSELALWQARFTQTELEQRGIRSELKIIKTKGDATQAWNLSFDKLEGKGFFTKELEDALLSGEIDLAVHSCKDLPTENPPGLIVSAYSKRADPFDVLLVRPEKADTRQLFDLPAGAVVGTSSARRKAQLLAFRPDIDIRDLRGNVPTRIQKLRDGQYDAILLARAGIDRLQIPLDAFIVVPLGAPMFIPAPAQGVLAFQVRENDAEMLDITSALQDESSAMIARIERQLLHDFEGGCQMPLGVYAIRKQEQTHIWISQASAWNAFPRRLQLSFDDSVEIDTASIVRQFKNINGLSVFVSSDLQESDYLYRALHAPGHTLHSRSLLNFEPADFSFDGQADWLFFSSRNAIRFFFDRVSPESCSSLRFAAVGESTAQTLREYGVPVSFTGDGTGAGSARLFAPLASGRIVFPMAENSLQEVQKHLNRQDLELADLVVYRNTPDTGIEKRGEAVLIFTSPMNAEAYFSRHALETGQRVIANGPSTSARLSSLGIPHTTAYAPYAWSLLDAIGA